MVILPAATRRSGRPRRHEVIIYIIAWSMPTMPTCVRTGTRETAETICTNVVCPYIDRIFVDVRRRRKKKRTVFGNPFGAGRTDLLRTYVVSHKRKIAVISLACFPRNFVFFFSIGVFFFLLTIKNTLPIQCTFTGRRRQREP